MNVTLPPKKQSTKGKPPTGNSSHTVGNHTEKEGSGDKVMFNHQVPKEFKTRVDVFCAAHGIARVQLIMRLLNEEMDKKGHP